MEFKFDANQEYQLQAIEAVITLLEGQPYHATGLGFSAEGVIPAVANQLDLDDAALLENLRAVQQQQGVALDEALACIEDTIETATWPKAVRFPNFSIEMETGTGKTYVYLRTALELCRRYGLRKFIIVVPSVAVREGVLKTLQTTEKHLLELYGNLPYRYYVYDSANLSQVRQFALSDSVELMVMTIDSFNKASNVIRQSTDRLQGETPIHLIQAARPVLILDEPQNMESELRVKALATLDPLLALRYSATHRNPYNLIYRLTPAEAYRQRLVKRIEVASVVEEGDASQAFIRLDGIETKKNTVTARLAIHKLMKGGQLKEQVITVRPGDSLEAKAERPEYAGFEVEEINPDGGFVRFANNVEISVDEARGLDREAVFAAQIRYTIEEHLRRQARLKAQGIKVLSLFFIDRVANYAPADSLIRRQFSEAFEQLKSAYPDWRDVGTQQVQAAYFAEKRRRGGVVEMLDSVSGKTREDEAAYDLIMRDKERLLSFEEPVAFIFSHSALREGWDNPNVFQICTLNQTRSDVKKRQEVGRGVRLAVDQTGERVHEDQVNILTVIANESYDHYVAQLQQEIEEEYGRDGLPPQPANARERITTHLRKAYTLKPEFQELWNRIRQKTRYAVRIDTKKLLDDVLPSVDAIRVRPPQVTITKARLDVGEDDTFEPFQMTATKTAANLAGQHPLPNLLEIIENLLERTSPPTHLTRRTLVELLRRTVNKQAMTDNPYEFAAAVVRILKDALADQLTAGIQYEKIDDWYEMTDLEDELITSKRYVVPAPHALYDQVICDSDTEMAFVDGLEHRDDVKLYLKLPAWFTVDTPVGKYNPDWAIVMQDGDDHGQPNMTLLYLVRETKSTHNLDDLRPDERRKILCGTQHFVSALGANYRVVTKASELP